MLCPLPTLAANVHAESTPLLFAANCKLSTNIFLAFANQHRHCMKVRYTSHGRANKLSNKLVNA